MKIILFFLSLYLVVENSEEKKRWVEIMRTANKNADNMSQEEECEGKDIETLCKELAHFTPQLCDNNVAKEKCTKQCGGGRTPAGIKLINSEIDIS